MKKNTVKFQKQAPGLTFSKYKPSRGLYLEGQINGGFSTLRVWGAYIWRGLYMEGIIFRLLQYYSEMQRLKF